VSNTHPATLTALSALSALTIHTWQQIGTHEDERSGNEISNLGRGLLVLATLVGNSTNLLDLIDAKRKSSKSSECGGLFGPFYRYELTSDLAQQGYDGWQYGTTPAGGMEPVIQAFRSRLFPGKENEVVFCTSVQGIPATPHVHWRPSTPGVFMHDEDTIKIPIRRIN